MPVEVLRQYVQLVRSGPGNEHQRLALLRQHAERVEADVAALQASLELIRFKASFYEQRIADGSAATLWAGEGTRAEL